MCVHGRTDRRSFRLDPRETPSARNPSVGKSKSTRKARREFSTLFSPLPPPFLHHPRALIPRPRYDKTESSSSLGAAGGIGDRDQLRRGKVEEGLILYLNTGLSRRTTCILTTGQMPRLSRCPGRLGIVKFPNYRYWGQGCGALNPEDGLHFELLVTFDMEAISVRSSSNDKRTHVYCECPQLS